MARRSLRGALTALLLALPAAAAAQDLPATARVTGVGARDVLNVRAAPSTTGAILSTLAPTATGVEVLAYSPDSLWAQVPLPEGSGWVARRFLAAEPQDEGLPRPLACRGTEPFWAVTLDGAGATLDLPRLGAVPLRPEGEAAGRAGWMASYALGGPDGGRTLDLTVVRRACSDGMSDRPYGLTALVWARGGPGGGASGDRLFEGCCTLQR